MTYFVPTLPVFLEKEVNHCQKYLQLCHNIFLFAVSPDTSSYCNDIPHYFCGVYGWNPTFGDYYRQSGKNSVYRLFT